MNRLVLAVLCGCGRFAFESHDAGGDGSALDSMIDAAVPPCGGIGRVRDDFEDGVIADPLWGGRYMNPGTSIVETNGQAVLTPASNNAGQYAGLVTSRYYDLRGRRFAAEYDVFASNGATSGIHVEHANNVYAAVTHLTNFQAAYSLGTYMFIGMTPDTGQRFMAISESGGILSFELSSDGVTFTPFETLPLPFDASSVRVHVFTGSNEVIATPGETRVANAGAGAMEPACKASSLVDTFSTVALDPHLRRTVQDPGFASNMQPELLITTDGAAGETTFRSAAELELRDTELRVELVQYPSQPSVSASFSARLDVRNSLEIIATSTTITAVITVNDVPTTYASTVNPAERFWRIAETAGTVELAVSTDGISWRVLRAEATPSFADAIQVQLRMRVGVATNADTIRWDNLNAP